jgi:MFS family permease
MPRQIRMLIGISLLWLPMSMLFDGINSLVLPVQLNSLAAAGSQATLLGLITFAGLVAGGVVQPLAGALSDHFHFRLGRQGFIGLGLLFTLASLAIFVTLHSLVGLMFAYLAIQVSAGIAQAGQQALIPDLVQPEKRGLASGFKGFMDLSGAMLGFVILGWLLSSAGAVWAIAVIAAALLVSYLLALFLTPRVSDAAPRGPAVPLAITQIFHIDMAGRRPFLQLLLVRFLFLLGIYVTGRFLLLFVADRLHLPAAQAAQQAGNLLAILALVTVLASPLTGWLADRFGRRSLIFVGAILAALSAILLIPSVSAAQIAIFGSLMSLGSASFSSASWAMLADLVPRAQSARYFGIANISTVGAAAAAGLFGPLVDLGNRLLPGSGFSLLFGAAALAFIASAISALWLKQHVVKEDLYVGQKDRNGKQIRADTTGLDVVSLQADPALPEEDQDPARGPA